MDSKIDRLIKLNSKLPGIIEFAEDEEAYKPRRIERALIGNPLSIAIHGRKGERFKGAAEGYGRAALSAGVGGAAGIGLGGLVGAATGHLHGMKLGVPFHRPSIFTVGGGIRGAEIGGIGGALAGGLHGTFGKGAEENYRKRTYGMSSKLAHLVELNSKLDGVIKFNSTTEDVASGVAGAGIGIGGYKALQAIRKKQYGSAGVLVGGPAAGATTAKGFGTAAGEVAKEAYHGAPGAIKTGLQTAGKKALSGWDAILRSLKLARIPA